MKPYTLRNVIAIEASATAAHYEVSDQVWECEYDTIERAQMEEFAFQVSRYEYHISNIRRILIQNNYVNKFSVNLP